MTENIQAAAPPDVDEGERERLRRLFERVSGFEAACDSGAYERSFAGTPDGQPAGLAWVPAGLGEVPALAESRVVEMEGPGGQRLLYVPLSELGVLLRQAAADRGYPEDELRPLVSLEPDFDEGEVYINGIFALLYSLARIPAAV